MDTNEDKILEQVQLKTLKKKKKMTKKIHWHKNENYSGGKNKQTIKNVKGERGQ